MRQLILQKRNEVEAVCSDSHLLAPPMPALWEEALVEEDITSSGQVTTAAAPVDTAVACPQISLLSLLVSDRLWGESSGSARFVKNHHEAAV